MIDKNTYLNLKREIKCLCRKNVVRLCDEVELNNEERELLMSFYDDDSRTSTCMKLNMSEKYYKTHLKIIFNKIYDYKNTFN